MPVSPHHTAVYTGSFDPLTLGHLSVIERASRMFERLVVGIGVNVEKAPLFTPEERVELVSTAISSLGNVEVKAFTGLSVHFVRECDSRVMLRGVRPLTDIAGEFTMMLTNRALDPEIETVFLMSDDEFAHVSSSLVRQIAPLATDEMLTRFVPASVVPALRRKLSTGA